VVIKINLWDDPRHNPEGEVIERLGFPGNPKTDIRTIIRKYDLSEDFPANVTSQAIESEKHFTDTEKTRREDFTNDIIYTIDPADAKDHDDAISVEKIKEGYRLGVYIADVSHFVRSDTVLDKEAFERGNSVYLPGLVIPMIPESLSNNLCSLKPNQDRYVFAAIIDYDKKGKVINFRLSEGVINSKAKLSYEDVQDYFDNGEKTKKIINVADSLDRARRLAKILQKNRTSEGSIDFGLPEAKITLGKNGEIIEIGNRVRLESHRLVEEFMLAANRAVALNMFRLAQKFLYRVHDKPKQEKIEAFSYMVSTLGHRFPASPEIKPIQFSRFLKRIEGKPEEEFLNELLLRSMQKAVYQMKNIGHFGLAFSHYTHFTSPIRRYPDLMVHRLLKKLKNGRYPDKLNKRLGNIINHVGEHCSQTERDAEAAERDAIKMLQIAYMSG
ncbi:MAG: VacB/RNase II family 3'-5' exoribonuclease, partial [candidate division Zixibacteria bacterium]|nr:VacB/RNase II family 3'-5' exoribonuclease [candidate division Zixibacteria bacterium]